jgi:type III secretion protein Q
MAMLDNVVAAKPGQDAPHHAGGPGPQRPQLEAVDPRTVAAFNAIYATRRAVLPLGERRLSLSPIWTVQEPHIAEPWTIAIAVDEGEAELILPQKLLAAAIGDLDPALRLPDISADLLPLLVEYALRDAFEALERAFGSRLAVQAATPGKRHAGGAGSVTLVFRTELQGAGSGWSTLRLPSDRLQELADCLAHIGDHTWPRIDLPLPVRLRWASVELTLAELRSLQPGDIVLADASCRQAGLAVAVIGECLVAPAEVLRNGYRLSGEPQRPRAAGFDWSLDRQGWPMAQGADAALADVPMRVLFEYGAFELDRSAAAQLRPGLVLPLARPLEEGLDIMVGGSRIGRGEIVTVGDALGVRVTRI